jgi:hypothetical protein
LGPHPGEHAIVNSDNRKGGCGDKPQSLVLTAQALEP